MAEEPCSRMKPAACSLPPPEARPNSSYVGRREPFEHTDGTLKLRGYEVPPYLTDYWWHTMVELRDDRGVNICCNHFTFTLPPLDPRFLPSTVLVTVQHPSEGFGHLFEEFMEHFYLEVLADA
jgi:hypothetical protein